MIQLCHQIIHDDLERTYYKMSISEKIKAINNNIEKDKAQYKIFVLSSENVRKYDFFNWQKCFTRKRPVRRSCYTKMI